MENGETMPRYRNVKATIDWKDYKKHEVMVPICTRSPAVRGRNVEAILEAMSPRIQTVHLVLCDSLDRYNTKDKNLSIKEANDWLDLYLPIFKSRFINVTVTRWCDVMKDSTFTSRLNSLITLYDNNNDVKRVIDENVMHFIWPKMVQNGYFDIDYEEEIKNSTLYLIEEYAGTAVYKDMFPELAEIYWGIYINDVTIFNRLGNTDIDLSLPVTLPVNINRLGPSKIGELQSVRQMDTQKALRA